MDETPSKELETIAESPVPVENLVVEKEQGAIFNTKLPEADDITAIETAESEPLKTTRARKLPVRGHIAEHVRFADVDVIEEEPYSDGDDDDDTPVGCEAIQQVAHRVAEQAEEFVRHVWKQGWKVVSHRSLPIWLKDNDFLVRGHRPELKSFRACFKSIFRIHTETGNIWTHLLGCVAFVGIFAYFMSRPSIEVQWQEKAVFSAFFCGAILCMGFSWLFHTVYCHSERIGRLFNKLDYCGIALLTMGSFVPWLYYSFYCQLSPKIIYLCLIIVLGSTCIVVSMWDKFAAPQYRPLRAGLFIGLGLSGVIPCVHYIIIEGFWKAVNYSSLGWLFLMAVLYITGAVIYAIRIPERLFPGKFDIWFQSHQIFHVFVVAAAFVHYHGISEIANYRLTAGDCSNPDSTPEMFSFVGT